MRRRIKIHTRLLALWLILGCSLPIRAVINTQSDTWGSTSMYRNGYQSSPAQMEQKASSWGYTPAARNISADNPAFGQGAQASSYFHSTSADELLSDYSSGGIHRNQRNGWGRPEDNPIGVVPDQTPVGEPFVLLVMALLYGAWMFIRHRRKLSA